jgi:hypothetical protein
VRRATRAVVAGVVAVLCAAVLAGCKGHSVASQPVNGVVTPTSGSTAAPAGSAAGAAGAGGTSSANGANGPSGAGVDSDLNAVDGQLSELGSAMAKATQSPSDGG